VGGDHRWFERSNRKKRPVRRDYNNNNNNNNKEPYNCKCGPGSSVGIATEYVLDGPGIESRWGRDFPPVQTGPGAHPAAVQCVPGLSRGKVLPGRAAGHSPPSSAAVMEE